MSIVLEPDSHFLSRDVLKRLTAILQLQDLLEKGSFLKK